MAIRFLPDGRMLLIQKKGHVRIANVLSSPVQSQLYMNLADPSHAHGLKSDQERGVLDLAIDPNFPSQPYIYIFYTPATGPNGPKARIARFTHQQNSGGVTSRGILGSEVILWEDTDGYDSCCHFGGGLDFGPQGNLWLTTGDHFQGSYATNLNKAGGKLIRITKNGSIPSGNPWNDGGGPKVDSLFAYGLRNPFRARWDLPSGRLFIGEVGGNTQSQAWEDLHILKYQSGRFVDSDFGTAGDNGRYDGINFGWPTVEGLKPHTSFPGANIDSVGEPIFAYQHAGNLAAITGGVVYRKNLFPAEYQGAYFYADSTRDFIRYLKFNSNGSVKSNPNPAPLSVQNPDTISYPFDLFPLGRIVSLEVGPEGGLYYVSFTDSGGAFGEPDPSTLGSVRRYLYDGVNARPAITEFTATASASLPAPSADFSFRATDGEGDPMTYVFFFGDGSSTAPPKPLSPGALVTISHAYPAAGVYQARLEVSDGFSTAVENITVQAGTPPVITSFTSSNTFTPTPDRNNPSNTSFRFGDTFTFSATATDEEDGPLAAENFSWSVVFIRPGNIHPALGPETGTNSINFPIPSQGQGFSGPVFYRCFVTVTDSTGLSTSSSIDIFPEKANITFDTVPSGIQVQVNGNTSKETPFILDTLIGLGHVVTVPDTKCVGETLFQFVDWANGPTTVQQSFVMTATNTSLTANFAAVGPCPGPPDTGIAMRLSGDAGLVLNGSSVLAWQDQTTNFNDLTPLGNPTLLSGELADLDAIHFDGVDDALVRSGFAGLPTGSSDRSIFMVARYNKKGPGFGWTGFAYGAATNNGAFGLTMTPTGMLGVQGWGAGNDLISSPATDGLGRWLSQGAIYGSGIVSQYDDGFFIGSTAHTFNTGTAKISLGEELNGGNNLDMDVAEILAYNRAVTESERRQIEDYFERRYSISTGGGHVPRVVITSPPHNGTFMTADMPVTLTATATDEEDGDISHLVSWKSSVDGALGSGASLPATLSAGSHVISVTVDDSTGLQDAADVHVTVEQSSMADLITDGLVLQLESDLNVSLASGDIVAGWLDQSGLGNDLTAAGDPRLAPSLTPTGKPALRLDGVGDKLQRIHATDPLGGLPSGNAERTMFVVAKYNNSTWWAGTAYGKGTFNQAFGLTVKHPTGELVLQSWGSDLVSTTPGIGAGWLVQSAVHGNGTATLYKNGDAIGQYGHTFSTTLEKISIGQEIGNAGFVEMDIAAVLIYDRALNPSDRASTGNYLRSKYLVLSTAPTVGINVPSNGSSFTEGDPITFSASASDVEDGDISADIVWSSNTDGAIGAGASISTSSLSGGIHTITASVTDSNGKSASANISVTVIPNIAPTVDITNPADGSAYNEGASIGFTAAASDFEDDDAALTSSIVWTSSLDGAIGAGASISTSSLSGGIHTITASVADGGGLPGSASISVTINSRPSLSITAPAGGSSFNENVPVSFTAAASDPEDDDSTLTASISWSSNIDGALGTGASISTSTLTPGPHVITTAVTDSGGLSASATISISINATSLPFPGDLVLRLDSTEGVVTSGGNVTSWTDLSGRGNNVTASGNPQLTPALTPGGRPAVSLDASGDKLERIHATSPLNGLPAGNANRTMFVMAKYNGSPSWAGTTYGSGGVNQAFGLVVKSPSGELVLQGWGGGNDLVSTTNGTGAGWLVHSGVLNSGTATLYKNGAQIGQFGHNFNTTLTKLVIGQEISNGGFVNMDVAGVLIYNRALSSSERARVESYLSYKYVVPDTGPVVNISAPAHGVTIDEGDPVSFSATANDTEDGDLGASIDWESNLDGSIGTGASFSSSSLSGGTHTITASATDSGGSTSSASINLTVIPNTPPVVVISAPGNGVTFVEGASIPFTVSATDTVDDDVSLTASISWSSNLDNALGSGGSLSLDTLSIGTHTITASVTDSGGLSGAASITVSVIPNTDPGVSISAPADGSSANEGAPLDFTATATDAEDDDATLSAAISWNSSIDGPIGAGASFSLATLSPGLHTITASVTDSGGLTASDSISLTINEAPAVTISAPTDGTSVNMGASVTFTAAASDAEDDDATLTAAIGWNSSIDGPIGAGGSFSLGTLSPGLHTITASVADSGGLQASGSVSLIINEAPAVTISEPGDGSTFNEGASLTLSAAAIDAIDDDAALTASIAWNSSLNGALGTGGSISLETLSPGLHTITASVTDSGGLPASDSISLTINAAPSLNISSPADGTNANEGSTESITFAAAASDAEDDDTALTAAISWSSNLDGSLGTGGFLSLDSLSPGVHTITASVTDSNGLSASAAITVTINAAPEVSITSPGGGETFGTGTPIAFLAAASDLEDDDATLSASISWSSDPGGPLGTGASISIDTLAAGLHTITASVTDAGGLTASTSISVTVVPNTAPSLSRSAPLNGASFNEGVDIAFSATATDGEDDDATLTAAIIWNSNLDGALGTGGSISTDSLSIGKHTITASVTDSGGLTGSAIVTVNVTAPPLSSELVLHLESNQGVGVSGGNVTSWADFSGQGNNLTASGDPKLSPALTPGGLPAISLDGNGDKLQRLHASNPLNGLPAGNANRTVFLLAKYNAPGGWAGVAYGKASLNQAFGLVAKHAPGELVLQGWGPGNDLVSAEPGVGAGWLVQSAVLNSGTATLFKNGAQIKQFNHNYDTVLSKLVIGEEIANAGFVSMDVAAVLIYGRALDAGERATVENYLHGKYFETPPSLNITAPANGSTFVEAALIPFAAAASDAEDDDTALTAAMTWSSDLAGPLGTGGSLPLDSLSIGTHTITASVTDSAGLSVSASITVNVITNTDPAVSISAPGDGSNANQGGLVTFTAAATDGEDDDATLSAAISWNSSIDGPIGAGGSFSLATLSPGLHTITASVADSGGLAASDSIGLTINAAPSVTISEPADGSSVNEGASVTFTAAASDAEDDDAALTASINWNSSINGPLGAGGSISLGALSPGIHTITASVTDSGGLPASDSISLIINEAPAVTISAPADGSNANEGDSVTFTASAIDAVDDDAALTASIAWNSSINGALGAGGSISITTLSPGLHTITASVADSGGLTASDSIGLTINAAPSVTINAPGDGDPFNEGDSISFTAAATDAEDDDTALTDSVNWNSSIDGPIGAGGSISRDTLSPGAHTITASVNDSGGLSASDAIGITINAKPSIGISEPADGASFGTVETVTFGAAATDLEDDDAALTAAISWNSSIDGAIGSGGSVSTGALSLGPHTITASVTDSGGLGASTSIEVTIVINAAPSVTISAPGDGASFDRGISVTFTASASDAEDDDATLTTAISWSSDLDGALGSGGSISTGSLSAGTHTITAAVTDGGGLAASASVTVTVTAPPLSADLVLHLESTQGVGTSGGNVTSWADLSGQGNNVTASGNPQLAPALTPTGLPAISLDGNGDKLQRIHATDPLGGLPAGNAARSVFVVAKYNTSTAWAGVAYGKGALNQAFGLTVKHAPGELVLQGWGPGNDLVSAAAGAGAGWLVQSGVVGGGKATLYKNGVQAAQFTHNYNTVLSKLVIGEEIANAGFVNMDVAAVLIYNRALDATERASVESYLRAKYVEGSP